MDNLPTETLLLCSIDDPTQVGVMNLYEHGDIWIKVKGCDECPIETRKRCCNQCKMLTEDGLCVLHATMPYDLKPYRCVTRPRPLANSKLCIIEYKCIKGSHLGKIRRIQDPQDVFVD